MHAAQRESLILRLLDERGFVSFQDLDRRLSASPATLRRDLERLHGEGKVVRVRGGVRSPADAVSTNGLVGIPFHENVEKNLAAKRAIGRAAAALCTSGQSIIIDGGSTTLQMCPHLEPLGLQVLSNSLHIVSALLPQANTRVSIPAGAIFREQNIVLSPYDDDGMRSYRASKMFMGAASIGRHGLMQSDVILIQAERRLIERADELVLLVDSSKFEAPAGHAVCALEEIDVIVTDRAIADEHRRLIESAGVELVIAEDD